MHGPHDRLLMRAAHHELDRWGRWLEQQAYYSGFAGANILETFIGIVSSTPPGSTIPDHIDMPRSIGLTHRRVCAVSEISQDTLSAWYVVRLKEDGTIWTLEEKCARLDIAPVTFRVRLHRAKKEYLMAA